VKRLVNEFLSESSSEDKVLDNGLKLSSLHPEIIDWVGNHTDQLIVIVSEDGTIKFASNNVLQNLNLLPDDIINKNVKSFIYESDIKQILKNLLRSENRQTNYSLNLLIDQRKSLLFQMMIKYLVVNQERFYLCYLEDETKDKQFEEMIIRSEKLSIAGQVAAGLAHEIRNPLTSLKGFIQLLQAGIDQKETYYKILLKEINKIEAITSELLYIAKPLTYHKTKESVNKLIQEVCVLLEPQAKIKEVFLRWEKEDDFQITCNATHMKQILINLVKNAIEASNKADQVVIKVYKDINNIVIDVVDEGEGIPEEVMHKLDEPFFTTKKEGTGLGIMITKNLLNFHNAKLKVYRNEDKGSTFKILIPNK